MNEVDIEPVLFFLGVDVNKKKLKNYFDDAVKISGCFKIHEIQSGS